VNEFLQSLRDWAILFGVLARSVFAGKKGKVMLVAACCQFWLQMAVLFFAAPHASTEVHICNALALVGVHLVAACCMSLVTFLDGWALLQSDLRGGTIARFAIVSFVTSLVVSLVAGGLWIALFTPASHIGLAITIVVSSGLGSALNVLAFVGAAEVIADE
jgi:hypothetical protein